MALSRFLLFLTLACTGEAFGQSSFTIKVNEERSESRSVPDPKSTIQSFWILKDPNVLSELKLNTLQREEVQTILAETNGSPNAVFFTSLPSGDPFVAVAAILKDRREKLDLVLDPEQRERLQQMVYHMEVARVGYAEALIHGFLGEDAGIEDSDRAALEEVFQEIDVNLKKEKSIDFEVVNQQILELLTDEQKNKLRDAFGMIFPFRGWSETTRISFRTVPNPTNIYESSALIQDHYVSDEIQVSRSQMDAVKRMRRLNRSAGEQVSKSVLTADQARRLTQLAYQFETCRLGLGHALCKGYLGNAIGITPVQQQRIGEIAPALEFEAKKMEDALARKQFLEKLNRAQREKVNSLLGSFFASQL